MILHAGASELLGGGDPNADPGTPIAGKLSGSTPPAAGDDVGEFFDFEEFADISESDSDDDDEPR